MEQVRNEQTIYSAAVYCRLSKDDEQAGESVSIETQLFLLFMIETMTYLIVLVFEPNTTS